MKLVFFGSPQFSVPFLNMLAVNENFSIVGVVTQPDKPVGRGGKLEQSSVAKAAEAYGFTILKPKSLRDEKIKETLSDINADVYVVVAYGNIIPPSILNLPRLGVINVHPSLLPKYRGATPMQSAILNDDEKTGITIMKMDEEMDHGPILSQLEIAVPKTMDYPELEMEVIYKGPKLLIDTLIAYERGTLKQVEQKHQLATYVKLFDRNTGKVDWNANSIEIERMSRAYKPWPGIWTTWNGRNLKLLQVRNGKPHPLTKSGTVILNGECVEVSCKKGSLVLERVQLTGSKPIDIKSFVNGHQNIIGSILGN
jgi:methionyl-tRNA formyltransferase